MKKIVFVMLCFVSLFSVAFYSKASDVIIEFSDNTTIDDDILNLGLNYENYKMILHNAEFDKMNVIAVSESTDFKKLYIYTYNAYVESELFLSDVYLSVNNKAIVKYDTKLISNKFGLKKYAIDCGVLSNDERVYKISDLSIKKGMQTMLVYDGFQASFSNFGTKVEVNYDTYLLLTDISVYRVIYDDNLTFSSEQFFDRWFFQKETYPLLFFYNFNLPQDVVFDDILEIDFVYDISKYKTKITGFTYNNKCIIDYKPVSSEMLSNTTESYTLDKPRTVYGYDSEGKKNSYLLKSYGDIFDIDYIVKKPKDTLVKNDCDFLKIDSEQFYSYDWSVLFDVRNYSYNKLENFTFGTIDHYSLDTKVNCTRIKYVVDGVTYTARVNDGEGGIQDDVAGDKDNNSSDIMAKIRDLWDKYGQWIIIGVIGFVGLCLFSPLLSIVIMICKLIWKVVTMPIKFLVWFKNHISKSIEKWKVKKERKERKKELKRMYEERRKMRK